MINKKNFSRFLSLVLIYSLLVPSVTTAVVSTGATVTPATGGTGISGSTVGGTYTSLTGPVLSEGGNRDIGVGTIVLNAPSGFEFDTSSTVTVTVSRLDAGSKALLTLSSPTAIVTSSTITITVSTQDDNTGSPKAQSQLTWSGIKVRPTADATTSGNITKSGTSSISGVTNGTTNFGALSETASVSTPTLTVVGAGAGNGSVTSNDTFINCTSVAAVSSGTCSKVYAVANPGAVLTATPDVGYTFTGWSGGGCSGTGTCTPTGLTGTNTVTVTATFAEAVTSGTVSVVTTPSSATAGSPTNFQVEFTNNTNKIVKSACVILPNSLGIPTNTSITGIADWTTTIDSQEIHAGYSGSASGLLPGNSFVISFTSMPTATGSLTFTSSQNSSQANCLASFTVSGSGVVNVSNTAPTISLNGANPMTLTVGDTFTDPGATGSDAEDGALTPVVTGTVDTSTAGSYVLTYTVTDSGSMMASVTRTVNVNEVTKNTAPTISLNGANPMTLTVGDTFTDPGATGSDAEDGALTPVVSGTVNSIVIGSYVLTYTVTDSGSISVSVTRTVNVNAAPNTAPTISLNGANPMTLTVGDTFTDPGATGSDAEDGALTPVVTGTVDTSTAGSYVLTYTVTDSGSMMASVTRTVNVNEVTSSDSDGDGIENSVDNCPAFSNPTQSDNDTDGTGDACDNDDDNDTVEDKADNCSLTANVDQADNDSDGMGNVCDSTPDPVQTTTTSSTSGGGAGANGGIVNSGGNNPQTSPGGTVLGASVGPNGEIIGSAQGFGGTVVAPRIQPQGEVLGVFTDSSGNECTEFITKHIRRGWKNDKDEVLKLQQFLAEKYPDLNLPITGVFGILTENAVKKFQLDNKEEVLTPWRLAGYMNDEQPTGFVYITTRHAINKSKCTTIIASRPELRPYSGE